MYDITKAKSMCSTIKGSCRLNLLFPNTQFVILTTPNNVSSHLYMIFSIKIHDFFTQLTLMDNVITGRSCWMVHWAFFCGSCGNLRFDFRYCIELKFCLILNLSVARLLDVLFTGFVVIIIFLVLKYLGACEGDNEVHVEEITPREVTETHPLMPEKLFRLTYGTGEEDAESGISSSSSEDLYDGKICTICYDEPRNCFFVPCGHCATCYDCAKRCPLPNIFVFISSSNHLVIS